MKIKRELLLEIFDYRDCPAGKVIEDTLIDTTRWSLVYRLIVQIEDRYYSTTYRRPATEMQDEEVWEYEEEVECVEVVPVEKTVIVYEPKPTT